jgi:CubicO group peptidase (beta-lactamase class C family)
MVTVGQTLDRATPESVGIPSGVILEWVDELEDRVSDTHSLMVVRHGRVAAEGWWAPNGPALNQTLFSLSKSFTSTAVGMAIAERRFGLDDQVLSFFPAEAPSKVSPNLAAMKVRHLLTMTTGHREATDDKVFHGSDGNWVRVFLSLPVEELPGTRFVYDTPATYMLSAIIQKRTGTKLIDYLRPRLFEPLGIENPTWEEDPRGINSGGFGLAVRTEDIARFGQLYLQKGVWGRKRLISAEWVEAATSRQVENAPNENPDWAQGYGYQFWRGRHGSYRGDGAFGQFCVVVPAQDLVVAVTAGTPWMFRVLDTIWEVLLPGLRSGALPEDPAAQHRLTRRLASLRLVPRPGAASSPLEPGLDGVEFAVDPNPRGLAAVRLEFDSRGGTLLCREGGKRRPRRLRFGRRVWHEGRSALLPEWRGQPLVASAAWPRPDRLEIDVCLYSSTFRYTICFDFAGPDARVSTRVNAAFGPTDLGILVARRGAPATGHRVGGGR